MSTDFDDIRQKHGGAKAVEICFANAYIPDLPRELNAENQICFDTTKSGKPKQTLQNLRMLLNFYGITVRYNVIKKLVEISGL